jgi:hypothetical protein
MSQPIDLLSSPVAIKQYLCILSSVRRGGVHISRLGSNRLTAQANPTIRHGPITLPGRPRFMLW